MSLPFINGKIASSWVLPAGIALLLTSLLWACQSSHTPPPNNNTTETAAAANTPPPTDPNAGKPNLPDPLPALANQLNKCTKVEYVLYNAGITFESINPKEVGTFASFIENIQPNQQQCTPDAYDAGVSFKNSAGDIVQTMEVGIYAQCNRVFFEIDKQKYMCRMKPEGINFFQSVINQQQKMMQEAQQH